MMSLYRTYRPKSFGDVAGQDHVISTLEQAVKHDRISHAYLFAGPRGTGKTSVARILAKILLTRNIEDETLARQIVQGVDDGNIVDLTEIDAASNRGIDDIRTLIETIQFTPVVGSAKVYIIDEVHMLTREAFNALLKTLEEPPPYAFFILATTELHKIPATIQSRCQRFLFHQVNEEDIVRRLQFIADQERITVERDALRAIAHHVQGGMRDAVSLLDQLRSLETITMDDVKRRIGETGFEYVERILSAIHECDAGAMINVLREMEETAIPPENIVRLLLESTRTRLHKTIEEGNDPSLHLLTLDILLQTAKDLRVAPVPSLVLESALLTLCQGEDASRKETLTRKPAQKSIAPHRIVKALPIVERQEEEKEPKKEKSAIVMAPEFSLEALKELWPDIVAQVEPPYVRMSLKNGQLHALEGNVVIVRFTSAFHRDKASSAEGGRSVEEALEKAFKRPLKMKYVLEAEVRSPDPIVEQENVSIAEAALEIV